MKVIMLLSDDLLWDIFSRLPIKSIIRCNCVCRDWRRLLQDPSFVQIHLNRCSQNKYTSSICFFLGKQIETASPNDLALLDLDADIDHSDSSSQTAAATPARVGRNLNDPHGHGHFSPYISSCNGLVCFCKENTHEPQLVCNPITGQTHSLPPLPFEPQELGVVFGIGFVQATGQYKVVRIVNHEQDSWLPRRMGVEIYTLLEGNGSWRDVQGQLPCSFGFTRDPAGLFVDGELHWWMYKQDTYYILCMDIEREKFYTVQVPEMGPSNREIMIDWKGCLGIVEYEAARSSSNIWVLKKAATWISWIIDISIHWSFSLEWFQLFFVNYSINCNDSEQTGMPSSWYEPFYLPLGVQKNGEILVLCEYCVLASYNLESRRFTIIEVKLPGFLLEANTLMCRIASFVSL